MVGWGARDGSSQPIQPTPKLPHLGFLRLHGLGQRRHACYKLADDLIHAVGAVA
jgi:hypothetical protein